MGAALDFRFYPPRAFRTHGFGECPAVPFELLARRDRRAGGPDSFHRAERFACAHRLLGRRNPDIVRAASGNVRIAGDTERRGRAPALAVEIVVAGAAPGTDHAGSREFLE